MLEFAMAHPFVTFFMVWVIAQTILTIYSRSMRAVMVSKNGWPPEHLDADGDWKPEKDDE